MSPNYKIHITHCKRIVVPFEVTVIRSTFIILYLTQGLPNLVQIILTALDVAGCRVGGC